MKDVFELIVIIICVIIAICVPGLIIHLIAG